MFLEASRRPGDLYIPLYRLVVILSAGVSWPESVGRIQSVRLKVCDCMRVRNNEMLYDFMER